MPSLYALFTLLLAVPALTAPLDGTRKVKRCKAQQPLGSTANTFNAVPSSSTTTSSAIATTSTQAAVQSQAPIPSSSSTQEAVQQTSEAAVSTSSAAPEIPSSSAAPPASSAAAAPEQSASAQSQGGSTGNTDADLFVQLHNDFRAQYGAGPVTWNSTMATYANNAASTCKYGHTGGPYGENIAAGVGAGYNITSAFYSWANEDAKYNWNSPGYSDSTGHFTQIVWKDTTQIGCAAASCADNTIFQNYGQNSVYVVCEYQAAGNVVGDNNQYFKLNVGIKIDL